MADNGQDEPKIIVDSDWKAQAQAEKEKLAAEQASKAESAGQQGGAGGPRELPEASFSTLVTSIASQALFAMGAVPDPETQKRYVDLDLAKYQIDSLKVLEAKTAGNRSDEETALLDNTLYELRSQFVRLSQGVAGRA